MSTKRITGSDEESGPRYLVLGEILRPHGIRGEIKVRILTDYPERITQLENVYVAGSPDVESPDAYQVEHMRMHQDYGLLKFKGINSRNEADALRELYVMVARQDAIPLEEGEFYLYQLMGVTVQTDEGETLGEIVDLIETGANDVYVVNSPEYGEVLIPALEEVVLNINIEQRTMIVRLPDGLLH